MATSSYSQPFVFIVSTNQLKSDDVRDRQKIRRQAMNRAGYARRMTGGYGKHNLLQYPEHLANSSHQAIDVHEIPTSCSANDMLKRCAARDIILSAPSTQGYGQLRIRSNFDILDLTTLTSFHVSRATACCLSNNPHILKNIVGGRQWSYLDFVPSRFEHSDIIRAAAECVSARTKQCLTSPLEPPSRSVIMHYLRALKALQKYLHTPDAYLQADVLCATELLGIYELLNSSSDQRWYCHSSGTAALIKARGPRHYKSDFEKALLLSHIGQIFHHAFVMNNSCFLDSKEWQSTIRSISFNDPTYSDRWDLVISLWGYICYLPYHFHQCMHIICRTETSISNRQVLALLASLRQVRRSILQWCNRYYEHIPSVVGSGNMDAFSDREKQQTVCFGLAGLIMSNRLIFALDPSTEMSCENEAQRLAADILHIWENATASRSHLFLSQIHLANTTRATAQSWQNWADAADALSISSSAKYCTLPASIFVEWCRLTGWRCP